MSKKQRHLFQDLVLLIVSVSFAIFIVREGVVHQFIAILGGSHWFEIVIAGMFFTSAFTTAPAIVILGTLAETTPLPNLVIFGALGAMLGDYIIFIFVKDRVSEDVKYLLSFSKNRRFLAIFKTRLFKFFVPFVGALIIASPFPDELGLAMLGLSKVKDRSFFLVSFIFNGIGILFIGWIAKLVIGI